MTRLFFDLNEYDIKTRTTDEGRMPLVPLVHPHEFSKGGIVMQDDNVRVRCALVDHPPVTPAFAYRFDSPDRSIVISGDTSPTPATFISTDPSEQIGWVCRSWRTAQIP